MRYTWFLGTALLSHLALAGTCSPAKDYSQYKDAAKTAFARELMASDACLYKKLEPLQQLRRDAEQCAAEREKMIDAIKSTGDSKNLQRALTCSDR